MNPDKGVLKLIKMQYSGDELAAMLEAWEKYPTLKKDCQITRSMKKAAREAYAKKLVNNLNK